MLLKALRPILWALAAGRHDPLPLIVLGEAAFRFLVAGIELGVITAVLQMSNPHNAPLYLGIHYWFLGVRGIAGPILGTALVKSGVPPTAIYWVIAAVVVCGAIALGIFDLAQRRKASDGHAGISAGGGSLP
jgi:hypothetical protein